MKKQKMKEPWEVAVFNKFRPVSLTQWERQTRPGGECRELVLIREKCFRQPPYVYKDRDGILYCIDSGFGGRGVYFNDKRTILSCHVSRPNFDWLRLWTPKICDDWPGRKEDEELLFSQAWIVLADGGCIPMAVEPQQELVRHTTKCQTEGQALMPTVGGQLRWFAETGPKHTLVIAAAICNRCKPKRGLIHVHQARVHLEVIKPPNNDEEE